MDRYKKQLLKAYKKFKKLEFSKKIAVFMIVIMAFTILVSMMLSLMEKETISDVTTTVITVCGGYLCTYGIKSAFEKHSRNMYGIDSNGIPYEYADTTIYDEMEEI